MVRWELLWLLAAAPWLLFPSSTFGLAMLVVPLLWGLRWLAWGRFVARTPLDGALLLLLLMVAVSLWATFDPLFSLPKVTGVVLGIALFYALAEGTGEARVARALALFLLVTGGVAAISLVATQWATQFPFFAPVTARLPRLIRDLPGSPPEGFNPNTVAGALLLAVPLLLRLGWPYRNAALTLVARPWRPLAQLALWLALALIGGTLLLTQSRGGYLGLGVGVVALLFLPHRRLLAAAGVAGVLILLAGPPPLLDSLVGAAGPTVAGGAGSLLGRAQLWMRAIYGIQDFPLTGMGLGMFRRVVPLLYPMYTIAPESDVGHAHNHLLNAGVDLGVPGLVAYGALWLGAAGMLWQVWRHAAPRSYQLLALGLAAGLAAHFVWGMFDANALGSKAGLTFWLALGVLGSLHRAAMAPHLAEG